LFPVRGFLVPEHVDDVWFDRLIGLRLGLRLGVRVRDG